MPADHYFLLAASLARPTAEQTRSFAEFVADAHSWYKHLPILPPGARFSFFLDPNAGRVLTRTPNGAMLYHDRGMDWDHFHYSEMPTEEYRRRFGFWQYETGSGPSFLAGSDGRGWDVTASRAAVQDPQGKWVPVPPEILDAGSCLLTGLVHKHFNPVSASDHFPRDLPRLCAWALENPSAPETRIYREIIPISPETGLPARETAGAGALLELHPAERERQLGEMTSAMARSLARLG